MMIDVALHSNNLENSLVCRDCGDVMKMTVMKKVNLEGHYSWRHAVKLDELQREMSLDNVDGLLFHKTTF